MVFLTDDLNTVLNHVKGIAFLHNIPSSVLRVKTLLETEEWRSCIRNELLTEALSKILGYEIPLHTEEELRVKEDDRIIYLRTDKKFRKNRGFILIKVTVDFVDVTVDHLIENDKVHKVFFS